MNLFMIMLLWLLYFCLEGTKQRPNRSTALRRGVMLRMPISVSDEPVHDYAPMADVLLFRRDKAASQPLECRRVLLFLEYKRWLHIIGRTSSHLLGSTLNCNYNTEINNEQEFQINNLRI